MDKVVAAFLDSIDDSKSTPLKQIVDRFTAKNDLRIADVEAAISLSVSQTKRFLAGQSPTRERPAEQLRQFLQCPEDQWVFLFDAKTRKARTHEEFQLLKREFLLPRKAQEQDTQSVRTTARPGKRQLGIGLALAALAGLAFTAISIGSSNKIPPLASVPPDRPCTIDLRGELNQSVICDEFGKFELSGPSLSDWNMKSTVIRLPSGWDVIARHETWGEPNYSVLVEEQSGYVQLPIGDNYLGRQSFAVYDSADLDGEPRASGENELNDKLQYLVIRKVGSEPMIIWEHDHLEHPGQLEITAIP